MTCLLYLSSPFSGDSAEENANRLAFLKEGNRRKSGMGLIIFSSPLLGESGTKCLRGYLLWQLILPPLGYRPFPPNKGAISFSLPPLGYRTFPPYQGAISFSLPPLSYRTSSRRNVRKEVPTLQSPCKGAIILTTPFVLSDIFPGRGQLFLTSPFTGGSRRRR